MKKPIHLRLVTIVSCIGIAFGTTYSLFGLGILPVSRDVLAPWANGVYGSTFIGLFVVVLLVGRHAVHNNDAKLMRALHRGLLVWLVCEAAFSLYYHVYFNVAVDVALMVLMRVLFGRLSTIQSE